jgi:hypothetical protein
MFAFAFVFATGLLAFILAAALETWLAAFETWFAAVWI